MGKQAGEKGERPPTPYTCSCGCATEEAPPSHAHTGPPALAPAAHNPPSCLPAAPPHILPGRERGLLQTHRCGPNPCAGPQVQTAMPGDPASHETQLLQLLLLEVMVQQLQQPLVP